MGSAAQRDFRFCLKAASELVGVASDFAVFVRNDRLSVLLIYLRIVPKEDATTLLFSKELGNLVRIEQEVLAGRIFLKHGERYKLVHGWTNPSESRSQRRQHRFGRAALDLNCRVDVDLDRGTVSDSTRDECHVRRFLDEVPAGGACAVGDLFEYEDPSSVARCRCALIPE